MPAHCAVGGYKSLASKELHVQAVYSQAHHGVRSTRSCELTSYAGQRPWTTGDTPCQASCTLPCPLQGPGLWVGGIRRVGAERPGGDAGGQVMPQGRVAGANRAQGCPDGLGDIEPRALGMDAARRSRPPSPTAAASSAVSKSISAWALRGSLGIMEALGLRQVGLQLVQPALVGGFRLRVQRRAGIPEVAHAQVLGGQLVCTERARGGRGQEAPRGCPWRVTSATACHSRPAGPGERRDSAGPWHP